MYFDLDVGVDYVGVLFEWVCDVLVWCVLLCIVGGDSKVFFGRLVVGELLVFVEYCGIVVYDFCELVIIVCVGMLLDEL